MKYLIVANGPFLAKKIILEAAQEACIIALDGAANRLARLNIKPNIILGDFDSFHVQANLFATVKKLVMPDQNSTDFKKALKFALQDAQCIHAVCATGGRMDHEQANIRSLCDEYSPHCPIYLHNECQTMTFVRDKMIHIKGQAGDYCGLFAMPEATMSVKNSGLLYGGTEPYYLSTSHYSSSNRLVGNHGAIVEIKGSAFIINPPMFAAQRAWFTKQRYRQ